MPISHWPFPFSQIMEILGVSADEAIYVGDNQYDDVLGAKGVGMKVAWVNRQGSPLNPQLQDQTTRYEVCKNCRIYYGWRPESEEGEEETWS